MITLKKNGLKIRNPETSTFEDVAGFVAPAGEKGEKGDVPIVGEDFWTEEEQTEIKDELKLYVDEKLVNLPPSIKVTASTEDIVDGETPLASGEFYLVYEESSNE